MNIGLMFVHEPLSTDRQKKQKETDKFIESKLGSKNIITNFIAWISSTLGGPIISFFKKNGFYNCYWNFKLYFFIQDW